MRTFFIRAVSITVFVCLTAVFMMPAFGFAKMFPIMMEPKEHWTEEEKNKQKKKHLYYLMDHSNITATARYPKEMDYVAENVTVLDEWDIDKFKAHTVSEILNRITGVFMNMRSHDFGSTSTLRIQDSNVNQVLVLVNGVKWNYISGGNVEVNTIPIGIIKQIEVIKGPASSAWGSSLGGVINIVTKTGSTRYTHQGSASVSYGEENTIDAKADRNERFENFGYYIYAQHMSSDGLRYNREFETNSLYCDLAYTTPDYEKDDIDMKVGMTLGMSTPESIDKKDPGWDEQYPFEDDVYWGKAFFDLKLTEALDLNISVHHLNNNLEVGIDSMGIGDGDYPPGQSIMVDQEIFDEKRTGLSSKLHYKKGIHEAMLGFDYDHEELDQSRTAILLPPDYEILDPPYEGQWKSSIDKYALFVNDTMISGKVSITPGLRLDYNDITGSFVSPSIGATYLFSRKTVARASVSRGFTTPGLSLLNGGSYLIEPNEDLDHEKIWSYQAGLETVAMNYFLLKTTLFHHDVKDAIVREDYDGTNDWFVNGGDSKRDGIELEIKTTWYKNLFLTAGTAYVYTKPSEGRSTNKFTYDANIMYDDLDTFYVLLSGHKTDFDFENPEGKKDDFIWDLVISKKILHPMSIRRSIEFFLSGHNIFNGSQYDQDFNKNPKRWVEAGVKYWF